MKPVKFLREPGYLYDLAFIFIYRFNRDYCLGNLTNRNKSDGDNNFFETEMYGFPDIPEDLFLFFYVKENVKCFFSAFYYEPFLRHFNSEFDFSKLMRMFWSKEEIVLNLIKFYFPSFDENNYEFYRRSTLHTSKLIDESNYSDKVKSKLYSFLISPNPVIEKLHDSLTAANSVLLKYYEKHTQTVTDTQNKFDADSLADDLKNIPGQIYSMNENSFNDLSVSFCLLNKNCVFNIFGNNSNTIMLLGYDYKDALVFLKSQPPPIETDEITNLLSEKNRLAILDLILEKEEASVKDFETKLKISEATAHYHISMMQKANMIKSRCNGKTVLYSLNKVHFINIIHYLKKYI